ncbi:class I SAM-dependent methyltransferase [Sphingomonas sp. NFR15]|uniref:class I SAM-dependent methyltransferase n=1 Tax=Sphingomonas sp. NFR15 TaxID=1566282 RepID=UPI0008824586|nr:class I SAM-dependent methyltransferase [Sphingomonas sp. NFR15]SDA36974.1 Methyltransferase domain-containing protein [Sphingomonas sp. NFR15]
MLKRIISGLRSEKPIRDTDRDWQIIGETEPFFGVLTADRFKRENLDENARREFFRSGEGDIHHFITRMREAFGHFEPRSALDFGCGVGRLTAPLAALTGAATGVDISSGMLAEARKHTHPRLRFLDAIPIEQFDWVVSAIVLQHIPPDRGYDILAELLGRVGPDGGATIQVMFGRTVRHENSIGARLIIDGEDGVRPPAPFRTRRKIPEGVMIMHDYDLSRVVGLFYLAGLKRLCLDHIDHGGIIGATIYARR